jgi:predicted PurR-regulated permease PerM
MSTNDSTISKTDEPVSQQLDEIPLSIDINTALLSALVFFSTLVAAYVAAEVILPIILAFVLQLILEPGMRTLERWRVPRPFAAILLIVLSLGGLVSLGALASGPTASWLRDFPNDLPRIEEKLQFLSRPVETLAKELQKADSIGQDSSGDVVARQSLGLTEALFRGTQHFASGMLETILVLFFLLVYGDTFLRRLVEIMPTFKDKRHVVDLSRQIEDDISAYLATITLMNASVGFATFLIMWSCGVGAPATWGVVAFFLNFVPIMGPFFGVGLFSLVGLVALPTLWQAVLPAALYLLVHVVEGEAVTPLLLARRFTLNPVLIIISLVFWFWMWGIPGAILSVPMLAIIKIICDGVKPLNAVGHFLEGD